jgi:hypothetical protein
MFTPFYCGGAPLASEASHDKNVAPHRTQTNKSFYATPCNISQKKLHKTNHFMQNVKIDLLY